MLTIARLAFREVLSKKIFYLVLGLTLLFLTVYGMGLHFTVDSFEKSYSGPMTLQKVTIYPQLLSLGLYFATFMVALMAVFSTVGAISGEIESGVIQAQVTKPIRRRDFVLGKFMGYGLMMVIYAAILYLAIISITGYFTKYTPANITGSLGLFLLVPLFLLALSLLGSSLLSTMANGITVFMLYIIGTVGGMVEQIGAGMRNAALVNIGISSSLVMPTDAIYRKMIYNLLAGSGGPLNVFVPSPFTSKNPPSDAMVVYTLVYIAVAVLITLRVFNRRDI